MKKSLLPTVFTFVFLLFTIAIAAQNATSDEQFGNYTPSAGFRLATTKLGTVNFRVFSYVRYLNQKGLDSTYTNAFGDASIINQRQDIQLNKVNIQFNGWLLDPKFRYIFYVWTNNTAQGQSSQVVVAGNLQYVFNKYFTLGTGITGLPGVRSTGGNFPFWLTMDNRPVADEFFRPSYTTGIWAKGNILSSLKYNVMIGNNMSQMGIDAGQLNNVMNTFSGEIAWYPTTGEYGFNDNVGDFENHQKVATRVAAHYTRSDEDRQGVPSSEAFENVTIRVSDGSVVFQSGLFGPEVRIDDLTYQMVSFDGGAKYKGFALEGEYYMRRVNNFTGRNVETLAFDELLDNGFQIQASAMVIPQSVQLYSTYSKVFGEYGDPYDVRLGVNWHPWKNHVVRWNFEYIYVKNSPIGGLSLPMPVGGNGSIFHSSFMVNF